MSTMEQALRDAPEDWVMVPRALMDLSVCWQEAALQCRSWHWDSDQRAAAEETLAEMQAVLAAAPSAAAEISQAQAQAMREALVERLVIVIHDGLGGNGWAYMNYGGDELRSCRKELENAALAVLAALTPQPPR